VMVDRGDEQVEGLSGHPLIFALPDRLRSNSRHDDRQSRSYQQNDTGVSGEPPLSVWLGPNADHFIKHSGDLSRATATHVA
jgi:hypothetical protein